jgi:hypothetical protein
MDDRKERNQDESRRGAEPDVRVGVHHDRHSSRRKQKPKTSGKRTQRVQ